MPEVVLFAFYGRRPNIELQLPFIRRILAENPSVRFDAWNLTRDPDDDAYVRTLPEARNEFHGAPELWNNVWRHYASEEYRDTIFVKLDDDVSFLETKHFGRFVNAARNFPGSVISAETVNNGASTPFEPDLWAEFRALNMPLLDVHMSNQYAEASHQWFIENWRAATNNCPAVTAIFTWLSINCIAFDWSVARHIGEKVGTPSPTRIADRDWPLGTITGDEGAANMLPRYVLRGFRAAHLTFGPQYCSDEQQDRWRAEYTRIAQEYLA
ncbi:hypothetical protein [Mycobacterium phage WXIN]|nr:hypothetical protein [Mycobacterium phage WXIN]